MYGTSVPLSVLAESMAKVRYEGMGAEHGIR
jgi:hypothetical protein